MKQGPRGPEGRVPSGRGREARSQHVTSNIRLCSHFEPAEPPPGQSPRRFAKTIQWPLRAGGGGAEAGWGDTSRSPGRVCPERLEQPRPPRSGSARSRERWLCRSETRNASGVRARPPSPPNCPLWDEACPRARHTGRTPSRAVPARQAVLRDTCRCHKSPEAPCRRAEPAAGALSGALREGGLPRAAALQDRPLQGRPGGGDERPARSPGAAERLPPHRAGPRRAPGSVCSSAATPKQKVGVPAVQGQPPKTAQCGQAFAAESWRGTTGPRLGGAARRGRQRWGGRPARPGPRTRAGGAQEN